MKTIGFCLPGACLTAFAKPGDTPEDLAEAIARRYEREAGIALEPGAIQHIENKIRAKLSEE